MAHIASGQPLTATVRHSDDGRGYFVRVMESDGSTACFWYRDRADAIAYIKSAGYTLTPTERRYTSREHLAFDDAQAIADENGAPCAVVSCDGWFIAIDNAEVFELLVSSHGWKEIGVVNPTGVDF